MKMDFDRFVGDDKRRCETEQKKVRYGILESNRTLKIKIKNN